MQVHEISAPRGAKKRRKIVGRGRGSGLGKTSGRGQTGQKARAGRGILGSLEGGQMALIRRLPKVGFRSHRPKVYQPVNLASLTRFKAGETVTARTLKTAGLIKSIYRPYKILGSGEIKNALTVEAYGFSKAAAEKITKAGGKTQTIDKSSLKKAESKTTQKSVKE